MSTRHQQRPQVELRPLRDGGTHAMTPSGRAFRIHAPCSVVWRHLLDHDAGDGAGGGFGAVTALLAEGGVFDRAEDGGPGATLHVEGGPALRDRFDGVTAGLFRRAADGASAGPGDTVVVLAERYEPRDIRRLERRCRGAGASFVHFRMEGRRARFGPFVHPDDELTYEDLYLRLLCAAGSLAGLRVALEPPELGTIEPPPSELAWQLSSFAMWLRQAIAGTLADPWVEVEADAGRLELVSHPVRPLPLRRTVDRARTRQWPPSEAALVDRRFGVVTKVERIRFHTPLAAGLHAAQAWVADLRRVYDRDASAVNAGCSYDSYEIAERIAVAESYERYSASLVDESRLVSGSHRALRARGESIVDPADFALFDPAGYADPAFPFAPFTDDLELHWVRGRSLGRGPDALLPAPLVYLNWYAGDFMAEPRIAAQNFAGVSAGADEESALANALEEVIERDAMMSWWLSGARLAAGPVPDALEELIAGLPAKDFAGWFLPVPTEFDVPVVAAVAHDVANDIATVGFACRDTYAAAAVKAWTEAVALQETALDLQRPDGLVWRHGRARLGGLGLRPYRADRRYLDDYDPDFRDVTGLFAQIQVNLDPRVGNRTRALLTPRGTAPAPAGCARRSAEYASRIAAAGLGVYACDLTTPDVAAAGMRVVRAVVPGALMNFPTAYPPDGGHRLRRLAARFGWAAADGLHVNALPLPYA